MSEFDKWWEENCMILSSDRTEAEDIYNLGAQSQQAKINDLTELNRLKTIALEQSVNRTSIHVHEKIVALEKKLKGNKDGRV